jgi:hypothetical protein
VDDSSGGGVLLLVLLNAAVVIETDADVVGSRVLLSTGGKERRPDVVESETLAEEGVVNKIVLDPAEVVLAEEATAGGCTVAAAEPVLRSGGATLVVSPAAVVEPETGTTAAVTSVVVVDSGGIIVVELALRGDANVVAEAIVVLFPVRAVVVDVVGEAVVVVADTRTVAMVDVVVLAAGNVNTVVGCNGAGETVVVELETRSPKTLAISGGSVGISGGPTCDLNIVE